MPDGNKKEFNFLKPTFFAFILRGGSEMGFEFKEEI
jgi:hypothetical protein